ncbi:shikimate kinase [Hugenholtzia roseola]|uniref:shikimate kinase n=1 Tax=Hugenholtzia roseola TaxID=1002 RepID=UPI0004034FF1|nr:shikimate kinase [Hugenholtzia roseola]
MRNLSKIFLIGMPAAGKTTWAKHLAERLQWQFLDTDAYIEAEEKRTIAQIFEQEGERFFRQQERVVLEKIKEMRQVVVATGGGLPLWADNLDVLKQEGVVVYLKMPLDTLYERVETEKGKRPLLAKQPDTLLFLEDLYQKRKPFYEKAHLCIEEPKSIAEFAPLLSLFSNLSNFSI